jgi:hypothetical protein
MVAINWVALQAVANAALVVTSGGAIAYAARQLRHEREYRSVDNLEKQLTFFLSDSFVGARRRLAETRVSGDALQPWDLSNPPVTAFEVLDFYDHLGLLVRKGHLDVFDVWHTFYEWAQPVYVDLQSLIEDEKSDFVDHYSELRRLVRAMDDIQLRRMHAKQANHWALWTPDRILEYYRYELEAGQSMRRDRRARPRRTAQVLDATGAVVVDEPVVDADEAVGTEETVARGE